MAYFYRFAAQNASEFVVRGVERKNLTTVCDVLTMPWTNQLDKRANLWARLKTRRFETFTVQRFYLEQAVSRGQSDWRREQTATTQWRLCGENRF